MEKICYKLEMFEGPLDLLLHLISKNKLNIAEIQITDLVDQYLEHVSALQEQNMDVASEFLEMAARLVYIKSVFLLPKHEEAQELQRELSGQLLEYQECKRVAQLLSERFSFDCFVRRSAEIEWDRTYKRSHTPRELYEAYQNAVGRGRRFLPPSPEEFSGIVGHRIVSVTSKIIFVLRRLRGAGTEKFRRLFRKGSGKSDWIATFLAVLELVKGKRIRVEGTDDETIRLLNGGMKHGN